MAQIINYDYHIHANVMNSKTGEVERFVMRAIELGLDEICITDHAPYAHIQAADRIPSGMLKEYTERVRALNEKYSAKISVKCGVEIDYHPSLEPQIEEMLKTDGLDYILGSSHLHLVSMTEKPLSEYTVHEYVGMCYENNLRAVKSGYFDTLAHIDMYRWIISCPERFKLKGHDYDLSFYTDMICEIFSEMVKRGMNLEINTHLIGGGGVENVYPAAEVIEIAKEYKLSYRYGSDAHVPACVGDGIKEITESQTYAHCWRTT